jgi:hypothetical protein
VKRHRLYGLTLASDFPFSHPLPDAAPDRRPGPVDVVFELTETDPLPGEARPDAPDPGSETVYRSPERLPGGESVLTAVRAGPCTILRFAGVGAFSVGPDRIVARPAGPLDDDRRTVLELRLLGPVLAFWLERSGCAALHASAVTAGGRAIVFLSSNHGGKSSLAAALMTLGHPMLTDDVLVVERARGPGDGGTGGFRGHPGYPQMRLWPEDVDRLLGSGGSRFRPRRFPRVHPAFDKVRVPVGPGGLGELDGEHRPVGCLYLPDRRSDPLSDSLGDRPSSSSPGPPPDRDEGHGAPAGTLGAWGGGAVESGIGGIGIAPVPPREAVLALVRHSFLPRLVAAMGWQERRLDLLARLVSRVPVRRLIYPSGHEHLPAVARAVLDDLERL